MQPFITYRENDKNGVLQFYILQREFPHYVARISTTPASGTWSAAIAGYHLWVVFAGTLRGNMVPAYTTVSRETQYEMDRMALWYLQNRILVDEKRFRKFKIVSNDTVGTK